MSYLFIPPPSLSSRDSHGRATMTPPGKIMYSTVLSGATVGVNARIIRVETHIAATISMFNVVGLPDSVVRESRARVYAAIKTSGFKKGPHHPPGADVRRSRPNDI